MTHRRLFLQAMAGAALAAPPPDCHLPWGYGLKPSQLVPPTGGPLFQPPLVKPRPRRLLSELAPDDPIFKQLKKAYDTLRQRSAVNCSNRTGLLYWAWMHDYNCDGGTANVHLTWDFLPWHRAFLYFHERTLQKILGSHFRLPIWDWNKDDAVPVFYREWIQTIQCVHGADDLDKRITRCSLQAWLLSQSPSDFLGTADQPGHAVAGPHSYVHTHIGRPMIPPSTAAVDPLFYAHHANVDRFWQFWRNVYSFHDEAVDRVFNLYDENGNPVQIAVKDLLDPERLGYRFEPEKMPPPSLLYPYNDITEFTADAVNRGITLSDASIHALETLLQLSFNTRLRLEELQKLMGVAKEYLEQVRSQAVTLVKSLPDAAQRVELPFRIAARPPDAKPGQYYLVGMRELSDHTQTPFTIGGFGIFANPGSHGHDSVIVTGCLRAQDLVQLLAWHGRVRFVYAPPAANGNDVDVLQEKDLWPLDKLEMMASKT